MTKYKLQVINKSGWYWRIVHKNGRILCHSEKYSSKDKAFKTAVRLIEEIKNEEFKLEMLDD